MDGGPAAEMSFPWMLLTQCLQIQSRAPLLQSVSLSELKIPNARLTLDCCKGSLAWRNEGGIVEGILST